MKILKFCYHMDIQFDTPVKDHHFTLKCLPGSNERQYVEAARCEVYPNYFISQSHDSYGNKTIYGVCPDEHDHFTVDVTGIVRTGLSDVVVGNNEKDGIYKYQTPQTIPGDMIKAYHEEIVGTFQQALQREELTGSETCDRAVFYMHNLHNDYSYKSGVTDISTTAEGALSLGAGVCQDYAQILLSLLRMEDIPCKYVTGMMLGEGFSHAWVEVLTNEGWIALDPTNDRRVQDDYIYIACGRDYKDCLMNQGVFTGCNGRVVQTQMIKAEVSEIG